MVDSDYKQQSEEQMFGTSVPEGERADESTFAKCLEDNEAEVIAKGRASPTRNPSITYPIRFILRHVNDVMLCY